jgi:hypothetical protein
MLYLRRLLYCAVRKISAEIKASDIQGDEKKKCPYGVSRGYAGSGADFSQGEMPVLRKRCRSLKIACEFKKQDK